MGTAFDDFIKQQEQAKLRGEIKPVRAYIPRPTNNLPVNRPHIAKAPPTPHVRRPQTPLPKTSTSKTEYSGRDFNHHPEPGYPKGFWNVLIVFFVSFAEEIWHGMLNSGQGYNTSSDSYSGGDYSSDSGGGDCGGGD